MARAKHIISVDIEDYYMVEAFADSIRTEDWDTWPSRVVDNTRRVLALFERHDVRATFFFLGCVAKKFPFLVKEAQQKGHEIACHSFWHRAIYKLSPEEFRKDTFESKDLLEQISGQRVLGYRAPSWSITKKSLWAIDILAEAGFVYDSSIFPIRHDLYGVPGAQRFPYQHTCNGDVRLREYPPATVKLLGVTCPAAGGGYLRIFPLPLHRQAIKQAEEAGHPVVVYFHPWEVDPQQPRVPAKLKSRFRHYTNLDKMEHRLSTLMDEYDFGSFAQRYNLDQSLAAGVAPVG